MAVPSPSRNCSTKGSARTNPILTAAFHKNAHVRLERGPPTFEIWNVCSLAARLAKECLEPWLLAPRCRSPCWRTCGSNEGLAHRNVTQGAMINRHAYELLLWKSWGVFALRSGVAPRAGARATPTGRELEQDDAVSGALVGEGRRGPRKRRKVEEDDEDWQRWLRILHKSTNGLASFFLQS